jgi:hypothetical protein
VKFLKATFWTLSYLLLSSAVFAEMYEIRAIGTTTPTGIGSLETSDWSVTFNDTGDQLLQVSEIVSFSGATVMTSTGTTYEYDSIIGTPDVTGISTESGGMGSCCWWFDGPVIAVPGGDGWYPTRWSAYQIERVTISPEDLLSDLVAQVIELNVSAGVGNALDSKLQNALDALDRAQDGDSPAAIGMLYAFIQSVEAQRDKAVTSDQADALTSTAERLITILEAD